MKTIHKRTGIGENVDNRIIEYLTNSKSEITEFETRVRYIDKELEKLGWIRNKNWFDEFEIPGMPNTSNVGYADYVLTDGFGKPWVVIEAKRTSKDPYIGLQQAKLYADLLEKSTKRRPLIFLTNGFRYIVIDSKYPERKVSGLYSRSDVEKYFNNLGTGRKTLQSIVVDTNITERPYQIEAIKSVCESFDRGNRRKALLVMATGSGKTRTAASLIKVLMQKDWVKNVLFLTDRDELTIQARDAIHKYLPNQTIADLRDDNADYNSELIFSTYQTMQGKIDVTKKDPNEILLSPGHFDLIILDEAHRSIYNKFKDIIEYFDGLLVGLTATPKSDISHDTYGYFDLPKDDPTFDYEYDVAVSEHYLVPMTKVITKLKFLQEGICYNDLADEEKKAYEEKFYDNETGELPDVIQSKELTDWLFNTPTIDMALTNLMEYGLKIDAGTDIGKTIIFAANHNHAVRIRERFYTLYPEHKGFAEVIDIKTNYHRETIADFKDPNKLPRIAISVDMMDTGIDVPEILNLVFFKIVRSRSKFWQMIGRGTRKCEGLIDGNDKTTFYVFDLCNNFEYFDINPKGVEGEAQQTLQSRIFNAKLDLIYVLGHQPTTEFAEFRKMLLDDVVKKVRDLNREHFEVKMHMEAVEKYSDINRYADLSEQDLDVLKKEIAPLVLPYSGDSLANSFDVLLFKIEYGLLVQKNYPRLKKDVLKRIQPLLNIYNIPAIDAAKPLVEEVLSPGYLSNCSVNDCERIRTTLRDLLSSIEYSKRQPMNSDFSDMLESIEIEEYEGGVPEKAPYRERVSYYINKYKGEGVIQKLNTNQPLSEQDIKNLEEIFWNEIGSVEEYRQAFGDKSIGYLVRSIIGLDEKAAESAFADFLNTTSLSQQEMFLVKRVKEYVQLNGVVEDFSIFGEDQFVHKQSLSDIITMDKWNKVMDILDGINANAKI